MGKGKKVGQAEGVKKGGKNVAAEDVMEGQELLEMDQAIAILKTTRPTFYRWLRAGKIKGMKLGRQWRFYREEIERFLKGEEPHVDLPANIRPLVQTLRKQALGGCGRDVTGGKDDVGAAVSLMLHVAYHMRASDIHVAPHMQEAAKGAIAILRVRVDGILHVLAEFDIRLLPAIVERWKALANCSVKENKRPQDGRILINLLDRNQAKKHLDLRVNFLPACLGESVTVRILDASAVRLRLDHFDYAESDRAKLLRAIEAPWGMVIVSGPTGSGKTTTLYACINHVSKPGDKVMTIEDPVEYFLPWAVQVQLIVKEGLTFATGMRAILRSDPDVIMVGEIRDMETLTLSQQAALTGHLVLANLHADEAARALIRMVDMGSDPFLVGDSTKMVMAQRLVRKLCSDCSVEDTPPETALIRAAQFARSGGLGWDTLPKQFRKAVGCKKCGQTGFKGRIAIVEVLEVTPEIASALRRGASVEELRTIAVGQGMTTMAADGIRRAANGTTTIAEVIRTLGLK
ncbi:MAG: ATPase, T2SS/T4P/T4SS family [Planctomycetota bacterium]